MARGPHSVGNILTAASSMYTAEFTVAMWVYALAIGEALNYWGAFLDGSNSHFVRVLQTATGEPRFQYNAGANISLDHGSAISDDVWTFVGASFGPNMRRIYNGATYVESTDATAAPVGTDISCLGCKKTTTVSQCLNGYLGPVGYWDAVLTPTQMAALATGMDYRYLATNLTHYYELDGVEGATDLIGSLDFTETGTVAEQTPPLIRRRQIHGPWEYGLQGRIA